MQKLTARQQQILELIRDAIQNTGFPPTRAEIAAELGFRSANAAEEHLQALARKKVIELTPGTSRGIRLCDTTEARSIEQNRSGVLSQLQQFSQSIAQQLTLPLVGRVAAGSPILSEQHVEASYNVDPSLFVAKPDYLLKVRGMSMRDVGILEGDLLAVKKTNTANNGQIVVARLGDEVTVKRYKKTGSAIELFPENPEYSVIKVDTEDFAIEGLAVGLLRSWN